jgi:hypothetical protein
MIVYSMDAPPGRGGQRVGAGGRGVKKSRHFRVPDRARRLRRLYGGRRRYKRTGIATVDEQNGRIREAGIHWSEAHGIGKRDLRIKRFIDEAP